MNPPADAFVTFLPTTDLERTADFYGRVLGLPLALDQGACRLYRAAEGAYLGFCRADAPMPDPARVVLTLVVPDVAAAHARLTAAGLETDGPPRANPAFRIEHFYAADPNGYRLEVQRFLHPFP